jgi:hypothetical protein
MTEDLKLRGAQPVAVRYFSNNDVKEIKEKK